MRNIFGLFLWGGMICLCLLSCNGTEDSSTQIPTTPQDSLLPPETVLVEFVNPYSIPLEARVFDHKGWITKVPVPSGSSAFGEVPEGLYTIGVKDTATDQYLHFYPSGIHPDSLLDTLNFGVKINPKGERDVRYRFKPRTFKEATETRLIVDMSLDSSRTYALANARWLYLSDEDTAHAPLDRLERMEAGGEEFIMGVFSGADPFPVPLTMGVLNEPLPQEIDMASDFNGAITTLIQVPDIVQMDSLPSFVMGEILLQAMFRSLQPIEGDSLEN